MIKITSGFQLYIVIFLNFDIINLNNNTRNILKIVHDMNIKSLKAFFKLLLSFKKELFRLDNKFKGVSY